MCIGSPKMAAPPRLPEAPTAPAVTSSVAENLRKKRQATSTILTSGQGVTASAATETKTLLGA